MIVVDTNVVSEAVAQRPLAEVLDWLRRVPAAELFTTAITEAELLFGVELLAPGRRRHSLELLIVRILTEDFAGKILPFDSAAAREFAGIVIARRRLGLPISEPDARIAAIARSRGAAVATRNVNDFAECGLTVINPWV